jgi:3-dehydroquinate synthase
MSDTIHIGVDSLDEFSRYLSRTKYSSVHFLADSNTNKHCMPLVLDKVSWLSDFNVIVMEAGEKYKTLSMAEKIVAKLLISNADRNALFVNVGGGVISDLGGFTASIYKRGIDFINIPTSLMGMVDASIGGKTGVNLSSVKNVVGTFTNANAMFIYPGFLKTLPEREMKSAYAEIIKHILLSDPVRWKELKWSPETYFTRERRIDLIEHSVKFKRAIVKEDFRDKSKRRSLNFGHTIGHAVESFHMNSDNPLLHGEAVACGLVAETYLSHELTGADKSVVDDTVRVIRELYPAMSINCEASDLMQFVKADKKNHSGSVSFSLISAPGKYAGVVSPYRDQIVQSINFMIKALTGK